jgi:hypothetical protein
MVKPAPARPSPLPYVTLVVVTLLTLWPCARGGFTTWDDADTIARNRDLNPVTAASFGHFWTRAQADLYVPVTYTVWGVLAPIARLSQPGTLSPGVYHTFNLLVHVGSVVLVYALLRRLTTRQWASAVAAGVFAVHPVQVETVAWASGTKDLLAAFFALAALKVYVASGPRLRSREYLFSVGFFLLALLSKPSVVALPLAGLAISSSLIAVGGSR